MVSCSFFVSCIILVIPLARLWGELGSTSIPYTELRSISLFPVISVATIGVFEAIASKILIGKPSLKDAET